MSASILLTVVLAYFALLLGVAFWSSRGANNESFFVGNRNSHWMLVAFGMIGTSLSGVTFISVPGQVGTAGWSYLQIALGQFVGYFVIAFVLLPLYYRMGLSSIYGFLGERLGLGAYRTGALIFMVSRTLGATARLYLVVKILQSLILERLGLPFWLTALVVLVLILLYTFEGGVKTIVWTDTLQTTGMLAGLVVTVIFLLRGLGLDLGQGLHALDAAGLSTVFNHDGDSAAFWGKQLLAGLFIAVAMTGLDQEMMQKNISVRRLGDSQKNIAVLSIIMLGVVLLFLILGGLLQLFAAQHGLSARGDDLFPAVVLGYLPAWVQLIFVIALISALFPSADGAITALTSSFCIDLIGLHKRDWPEARKTRVRRQVHLSFAAAFLALVLVFRWIDNPSMIGLILKIAGYTYGPLLGLFAFGLLVRHRRPADAAVPWVALGAPLLCWVVDANQEFFFGSYRMGLELLVLNGALTFAGLLAVSRSRP